MFNLFCFAVYLGLIIVGTALSGGTAELRLVLKLIFFGIVFVPLLAVQTRRFHDQNKSGRYCLLGLIPLIGGLIVFVFMLLEGTRGPNQYGPDPKA